VLDDESHKARASGGLGVVRAGPIEALPAHPVQGAQPDAEVAGDFLPDLVVVECAHPGELLHPAVRAERRRLHRRDPRQHRLGAVGAQNLIAILAAAAWRVRRDQDRAVAELEQQAISRPPVVAVVALDGRLTVVIALVCRWPPVGDDDRALDAARQLPIVSEPSPRAAAEGRAPDAGAHQRQRLRPEALAEDQRVTGAAGPEPGRAAALLDERPSHTRRIGRRLRAAVVDEGQLGAGRVLARGRAQQRHERGVGLRP
jgi:hypothetical protein